MQVTDPIKYLKYVYTHGIVKEEIWEVLDQSLESVCLVKRSADIEVDDVVIQLSGKKLSNWLARAILL